MEKNEKKITEELGCNVLEFGFSPNTEHNTHRSFVSLVQKVFSEPVKGKLKEVTLLKEDRH